MNSSTKKLLLVTGLLVLAVVFLVASFFANGSKQPIQTDLDNVVILDNSDVLTKANISDDDVVDLESALYLKAVQTISNPPNNLNGTVRDNSLKVTSYNYAGSIATPYYRFTVDLPGVKRTFQATLAGGENSKIDIVHVLCPSKQQLIYPAFKCQDPAQ